MSGSAGQSESEMVQQKSGDQQGDGGSGVSRAMSSPTIKTIENAVSGHGLALVGVSVEQDAAYWEWHIEKTTTKTTANDETVDENELEGGNNDGDSLENLMKFGLSTKKKPAFYKKRKAKDEAKGESSNKNDDGTSLMRAIPNLKDGDTVGVAVQQCDLPMVQFLINGEPIHNLAINRFRGAVFPSVWLSEGAGGCYKATLVLEEDKFSELAPHVRFGPLIAARGII